MYVAGGASICLRALYGDWLTAVTSRALWQQSISLTVSVSLCRHWDPCCTACRTLTLIVTTPQLTLSPPLTLTLALTLALVPVDCPSTRVLNLWTERALQFTTVD